jgi:hypothetical protein
MRISLVLLPLAACAAPALAQPAAPPATQLQVPPEITDPATAARLVDAMKSLSKALLDLPVGEVRAAIEGRKPTATDRTLTVRKETGLSEQQLHARTEAARPMLEQSTKAMAQALPQMMQSLAGIQQTLDRAMANMPDPNYPKR